MERFFSKKSVAVFLTTIILFGFFNINSAHADWGIGGLFVGALTDSLGTLYSWFLNLVIIPIASFCLAAVGIILDFSIKYTVYGEGFGLMDGAIRAIWTLLRDTANITFIFFLLYAGIQQILSGSMKKDLLVSVIMTAVLINFSLFTTKILIDAGNLVATAIYKQIEAGGPSGNAAKDLLSGKGILSGTSGLNSGIDLSGSIMAGLDITTIYDVTGSGATALEDSVGEGGANSINGVGGLINSTLKVFKILALFYVFIFLAVMFIGRYVTLVILMATSPMGFIFGNIPGLSKWSSSWRSQLTQAIMMAPTIMFLLLLTIRLSQYLPAVDNVFISIFNFMFVVYMLNKSMTIVKGMSGEFGAMADTLGKAAAGLAVAGVTGGASYLARGTIGATATKVASSKWGTRLGGMASSDNKIARVFGRAGTSVLNAGATSSFDVRNAPGYGNLIGGNLGIQADSKLAGLSLNQGGQRADIKATKEKAQKEAEAVETQAKEYRQSFVDTTITEKVREERAVLEKQLSSTTDLDTQANLRNQIAKKNEQIADLTTNGNAVLEKMRNLELQDEIEALKVQEANQPDPVLKKQITDKIELKEKELKGLEKVEDLVKATNKVNDLQTEINKIKTRAADVATEETDINNRIAAAGGVRTTQDNEDLRKLNAEADRLADRLEKTEENIKVAKEKQKDVTEQRATLNNYRATNTERPVAEVLETKNRRADFARSIRSRKRESNYVGWQESLDQISEAAEGVKPKDKK